MLWHFSNEFFVGTLSNYYVYMQIVKKDHKLYIQESLRWTHYNKCYQIITLTKMSNLSLSMTFLDSQTRTSLLLWKLVSKFFFFLSNSKSLVIYKEKQYRYYLTERSTQSKFTLQKKQPPHLWHIIPIKSF